MKKGLWLVAAIAVGCGAPPLGIDGVASESAPAWAETDVQDGSLAAKRGGRRLGHRQHQHAPEATICTVSALTGDVECWASDPIPLMTSPLAETAAQ